MPSVHPDQLLDEEICHSHVAGDISDLISYTDEDAQDAVGGILDDGFTYDDATPKIKAKGQIVFTLPAVAGAKCRIRINKSITITSAIITGDVSGSAVVDIWKDTTANYPPTVDDTITALAKPTLSSQAIVTDSTLTGWTKSFVAGDWLVAKVDSASTLNDIQVILTY